MLQYLRYRYAKARMTAYINGELSVNARRYVARQIDSDPRCRAEFNRQRAIKEAVEYKLPAMGRPEKSQLDSMWANIQTQLVDNSVRDVPANTITMQPTYSLGYVLAIILCLFGVLLPFSFKVEGSEAVMIEQPMPNLENQFVATAIDPTDATQEVDSSAVALVSWTEPGSTPVPDRNLHNTPSPQTPTN